MQHFTERLTQRALKEVARKLLRGALKELNSDAGPKTEGAAPDLKEGRAGEDVPGEDIPREESPMATEEHRETTFIANPRTWIETLSRLCLAAFRAAARRTPRPIAPLIEHIRPLAAVKRDSELIDTIELHLTLVRESIVKTDTELGDLVIKGITVMIYALKMADRLRFDQRKTVALMLAGLLHHIGLAMLPSDLRRKKGHLSAKERELLHVVPKAGAAFVRRCGLEDPDVLAAIRFWRERFDGSGPEGMKGKAIPLPARIIGLLTTFEALIHYRPYRKRLLPRDAVSLMIKESKKEFDPALLKDLIESLSIYPVGSYVQLNSGDIGMVLTVNPQLPLRPKIRLVMNREGEDIEPREVDLTQQPNLMVRRCVYEEELEKLKAQADVDA